MTRATASFAQEYYTSELSPLTSALAQDSNNWADEGVRDISQPPQASCLLFIDAPLFHPRRAVTD